MVMPADRLFTRKYLKYLFPKAHIEMARYTICDSSEWVYWIFCFLSVLCGFYWEGFCPQLSIWCVMIEWRCFSKKCEQCHSGLFIDITCKKFQNNSSVLFIASKLQAMNSLLKFTFWDRPLLTMCVYVCVLFGGLLLVLLSYETASVNSLTSMKWTNTSLSATTVELARSSLVLTTSCPSICRKSTKI